MKTRSKSDWPRIRTRTQRGKTYWSIDCGMVDGKRIIYTRSSEKEAKLEAERLRRRHAKVGNDALRISDDNLRDAVRALELLGGNHSLVEAAEFLTLHGAGEAGTVTVHELYDLYVQDRIAAHRSPRTIQDIKERLGKFTLAFGDVHAHQITTNDLQAWIDKQNPGAATRRSCRVHLSGLLNYALSRRYIRFNPASALTVPKQRIDKRPGILSVPEVRTLLRTAQNERPEIVPYIVLATFAGIRPHECRKLDWEDISFDREEVFIGAQVSKTGHERYVHLQPNAVEWLLPYRQRSGTIFYQRKHFDHVRSIAQVQWHHDCMRHTFGSMHLAAFRNAGDTAEQMGHGSSTTMLFKHYRRAVRQEDAQKFWDIKPGDPACTEILEKTS